MLAATTLLGALLVLIAIQITPWEEVAVMGTDKNTQSEVEDSQVFDLQDHVRLLRKVGQGSL
jgi:hypothetical protein